MTKHRFTEIEGMRGVLSIVVVLYHFGLNGLISKATGGLIEKSYWGNAVDFFFVISGFVLGYAQYRNPKGWTAFAVSRIFRLLPSYLFLFIVFLPLTLAEGAFNTLALALSTLGLAYPAGLTQWNGASWSMSVELYLPIVLAHLFILMKKFRGANLVIFIICIMTCAYIAMSNPIVPLPHGFVRGFFGIALGISLFFIVQARPSISRAFLGKQTSLIFFACYLIITLVSDIWKPIGAIVPILAVLAIVSSSSSSSILSSRIMVFLGSITFTLYLIHMPLQSAAIYFWGNEMIDGNVAA